MKVGRPPNLDRLWLGAKFKLTSKQRRSLTKPFIDQLARCKTDACRRLLLGVSR